MRAEEPNALVGGYAAASHPIGRVKDEGLDGHNRETGRACEEKTLESLAAMNLIIPAGKRARRERGARGEKGRANGHTCEQAAERWIGVRREL